MSLKGVEIYNNTFNGMVSVPRAGGQPHPSDRGAYTYTVRHPRQRLLRFGGGESPRKRTLKIDHTFC